MLELESTLRKSDTRAAHVKSTAPLRLSPSTEPWVDRINDFAAVKGLAWEEDYLRVNGMDGKGHALPPGHEQRITLPIPIKNGAVRLLMARCAEPMAASYIWLRNDKSGEYRLSAPSVDGRRKCSWYTAGTEGVRDRIANLTDSTTPAGAPVELEFRAVGSRLLARMNGRIIGETTDTTYAGAEAGIAIESGALIYAIQTLDLTNDASIATLPSAATTELPFVNTLGMKFVPVPGTKVLFSIWETRVRDYAEFARMNEVDNSWTKQQFNGVPVGREPEHPVYWVTWDEANAFCKWITDKDSAGGKLPKGAKFRLPSDEEWSRAVGLTSEQGGSPAERNQRNKVDYPWGIGFPPRGKAGNYADTTFHEKFPSVQDQWLEDYADGFATTAPVGSFPPNEFGIYDLGGNVSELCEDWFDASQKEHSVRGAKFNLASWRSLLSSSRHHVLPTFRAFAGGFRCVLELEPASANAASVATPKASIAPPEPKAWIDVTPFCRKTLLKAGGSLSADGEWVIGGDDPKKLQLGEGWSVTETANVVIRARYRNAISLKLREGHNHQEAVKYNVRDGDGGYSFDISNSIRLRITQGPYLASPAALPAEYQPDAEHEAIGVADEDKLMFWVDGELLAAARDSRYPSGTLSANLLAPGAALKKLEYGVLTQPLSAEVIAAFRLVLGEPAAGSAPAEAPKAK